MKEVLRTGFSMDNLENIGEIMINCADKISFFSGNSDGINFFKSN